MRLLYISSVPCAATAGGPLQIYRHFRERSDFEFVDLNISSQTIWEQWIGTTLAEGRAFKRLRNTRLFPYLLWAAYSTGHERSARALRSRAAAARADAIVTVGYGRMAFVAQHVSRLLQLPLITFFHDWWPDLVVGLTPRLRSLLDARFRRLALQSDLIFPVTRALSDELGGHPNSVILAPIPASVTNSVDSGSSLSASKRNNQLLVYAGVLSGTYGKLLRGLAHDLLAQEGSDWSLRLYGPTDDWPEAERALLEKSGIYRGNLQQGQELDLALSSADALLVVMDFEPQNYRRVRTSFPSKLLDYARFRKPLVTWGPEHSFAVCFSREKQLGLVVTDKSPSQLWKNLKTAASRSVIRAPAIRVLNVSRAEYSANVIHARLKSSIQALLRHAIVT